MQFNARKYSEFSSVLYCVNRKAMTAQQLLRLDHNLDLQPYDPSYLCHVTILQHQLFKSA